MTANQNEKQTCGIIMPISGSDGYTSDHWVDVKNVIEEAISEAGFIPNLVSEADEIGIIHNRIVSNIYNNPIVVCDVSSKNPNVMFELGLRLAFDKATIIIKDNQTDYNFDTSPIEHLTYPKDLRYSDINKFKVKLRDKLASTYKASLTPEYSTFLKNFIQYKPTLQSQEIGPVEYIFKELEEIKKQLRDYKRPISLTGDLDFSNSKPSYDYDVAASFNNFLESKGPQNFQNKLINDIVEDFKPYLSVSGYNYTKIPTRNIQNIVEKVLRIRGIVYN